jgi:hypothetical protein
MHDDQQSRFLEAPLVWHEAETDGELKNKQLHFQTRILIEILEEFQSHLINFPLKLPISILIKIIEEFHKISTVI